MYRLLLLLLPLLFLHVFLIALSLWHSFTRVRIAQANLNFKISTLTAYRSAKINALTHTHTLILTLTLSLPLYHSITLFLVLQAHPLSLFSHTRAYLNCCRFTPFACLPSLFFPFCCPFQSSFSQACDIFIIDTATPLTPTHSVLTYSLCSLSQSSWNWRLFKFHCKMLSGNVFYLRIYVSKT